MSFEYKNDSLTLLQGSRRVLLEEFVKNKENPMYIYDLHGLKRRVEFLKKSLKGVEIFFAVKSNDHPFLLKNLSPLVGADVVSLGEIKKCLKAGFSPKKIIFSGVAKTRKEIKEALQINIRRIHVESLPELQRVSEVAGSLKKRACVSLRINPHVDLVTHKYIKTGLKTHKFGLDMDMLPEIKKILKKEKNLICKGISSHIGSQVMDIKPFEESFLKMKALFLDLKKEGFPLEDIDLGGGLGIDYEKGDGKKDEERILSYSKKLKECFKGFKGKLLIEPGRILVARYGMLLARVEYVKETGSKTFAITNTGMHHLLRPALYGSYHRILPLKKRKKERIYDVVGPICESGDVIGEKRKLSYLNEGDWLGIADSGAYGRVMSNQYNSHPYAKEYFFSNGKLVFP